MPKEAYIGSSIGLLGVIVAVVQGMYPVIPPLIGWPIVGVCGIIAIVFIIIAMRKKEAIKVKQGKSKKEHAQNIHKKIMELDTLLDKTTSELSKDEKWLQNPDVRGILDKLQVELNNLGYLVNSRDYDRWAEAFMTVLSKELYFNDNEHDEMDEWGRARVNAKLRDYVSGIKG